jgi:hypothetical protein
MKAEDLKGDRVLRGPIFSEPVKVIVTAPMGDAVKGVGRGLQGVEAHRQGRGIPGGRRVQAKGRGIKDRAPRAWFERRRRV